MDIIQAREIFKKISVTQICDAAKNARILNGMIHPFIKKPKMLGKAFTVKSDGDVLPIIRSLELASSDNVIIIDSGNSEFALAGELLASEARRKKIAGIVLDGFCRDVEEINKIGLPFYAKGICPRAGSKDKLGEINIPIECGGISILPNDIIIGDENGIVILNEKDLADVFHLAQKISKKEDLILEKVNSGTSILEMSNFAEHYYNLTVGKESVFEWKIK